ncbi:CPBP family intramembrane metalloprotease [Bacillus sp. ISL-35]|uniref:CPBP family intramembrane glutamic endopeptidase n=1 Tax=Bacillus sp. ISL-35 TaxID=2819122 RepID=UPI001BE7AF2F|nr:type II CAAX endopeptidase family protein [Bacillus sp. ISL-35]MBT2678361.1 CPBP family intramembrane metalloprotease [Bacillus sp. ISL-35]MBT2705915.1 CPBP family intramembrane metalloprotease [Chryseobacterium sp. ISL-80]
MKKWMADPRLILGILIAHLLMFFTFEDKNVFWYIFTASMLVLISFSIIHEEIEDNASTLSYLTLGIISGAGLFGLFWFGSLLIELINLPFSGQISSLYSRFSPELLWHYIVLVLIIAPGEEIFWRGFIQERLSQYFGMKMTIGLSVLLYASVHFYSGQAILILAAVIAGLAWSILYAWKRSMPLVIVSHIVFDLLLFVFLPLR